MSQDRNTALLIDLAKLLKKHGPRAFESLAAAVTDPEFARQFSEILGAVAVEGRRSSAPKHPPRKKRSTDLRSSFLELERTDPERSAVLLELHDGLKGKAFLPTLRDVRAFAHDHGLPEVKGTSRERALTPFIRSLAGLPMSVLQARLEELRSTSKSAEGLEGWSNIILHQRRDQE